MRSHILMSQRSICVEMSKLWRLYRHRGLARLYAVWVRTLRRNDRTQHRWKHLYRRYRYTFDYLGWRVNIYWPVCAVIQGKIKCAHTTWTIQPEQGTHPRLAVLAQIAILVGASIASRGVNKVILVGNLGQDPEVKYMPNGNAVTNLSIATSESWKDQQGQPVEKTEWCAHACNF